MCCFLRFKKLKELSTAIFDSSINILGRNHTINFFCTTFLHQSCERPCKFMFHYFRHLSAILFHSRVKMKIRVQKVLLRSCGEIEPNSILPASFLKATVLNDENYAFSRTFENIQPQTTKQKPPKSMQKTNASQLSSENVARNFTAFDLIDIDVLLHCVCSFLIFLQRLKCVACCFVHDRILHNSFYSNLCLAFSKFILKSYSINHSCSVVINIPSWSTHEIELLIREIEEMQCFWNMFNPEYKDKIK